MTDQVALECWPDRFEKLIARRCRIVQRAIVLRETESTQDAARANHAKTGDVFIAWRQTAGRGRLGRTWTDTHEDGVALTMVFDHAAPERLSIAIAIGVAWALEALLCVRVGIKWPNDIVVNGRKLAGILVEQTDAHALIGIGVNVRQRAWPAELDTKAVSLSQLGSHVERAEVIEALVPSCERAMELSDAKLSSEFATRDVLSGCQAEFRVGRDVIRGKVVQIDPQRGLLVETKAIDVWLPASTTTMLSWCERPETKIG